MPAIITHDFFGRDVYDRLYHTIGGSRDEADAFLLGNQGPDPLFYTVISPQLTGHTRIGNTMHSERPTELIKAFRDAVDLLPADEHAIGRAYALGFLCHYTLDSTMHPYVYYHEYALCDAGEPGLSRADGHEVHAIIESELDELVLFAKREETIRTFNPATEILRGSPTVLRIASKLYAHVAAAAYGETVPPALFAIAVKDFRLVQRVFYSPTGLKRSLAGRIERTLRRHSFFQSMSHRATPLTESIFDNRQHRPWKSPFTNEVSTKGFWDLFTEAKDRAVASIAAFDAPTFTLDDARELTGGLNFSGDPTEAVIVAVEDHA